MKTTARKSVYTVRKTSRTTAEVRRGRRIVRDLHFHDGRWNIFPHVTRGASRGFATDYSLGELRRMYESA